MDVDSKTQTDQNLTHLLPYHRIEKQELHNDVHLLKTEVFQNSQISSFSPAELALSDSEESEGFEEASIDSAAEDELIRKTISDSNFYKIEVHQKIEIGAPEKVANEKIRKLSESGKYTVLKPGLKDFLKPTLKPISHSMNFDQRKMKNGDLAQCLGVVIRRFYTGKVDDVEWCSIQICRSSDEAVHIQGRKKDAEVMLTENLELMVNH